MYAGVEAVLRLDDVLSPQPTHVNRGNHVLGLINRGGAAGPAGGLASILDLNGDGNALDDILRMAGKDGR